MYLKSIEINHFRNHDNKTINFSQGINIIQGNNGSGKSNLLEAILLLSFPKSNRTPNDRDMIQFHFETAKIKGIVEQEGIEQDIEIQISNQGKKIFINGKVIQKSSLLLNLFHTIYISNEDYFLITRSPSERRQYLDVLLSKLDVDYFNALKTLKKLNKQKSNIYRKNLTGLNEMLYIYQSEVNIVHHIIVEKRKTYLQEIKRLTNSYIDQLKINKKLFSISFDYKDSMENVKSDSELLEKEKQFKEVLFGAHRDDFVIINQTIEVKRYMSFGEKQLIVLLMKLSEKEYVKNIKNVLPVLIMDDPFLGLDKDRKKIFKIIMNEPNQKIITTTEEESEIWSKTDVNNRIML